MKRFESDRLRRPLLLLLALLLATASGFGCEEETSIVLVDGADNTQRGDLVISESKIVAVRDGASLSVDIPILSTLGLDASGEVEVALRDLDGNLMDSVRNSFSLKGGDGVASVVLGNLPATAETGDLANYVLHYRVRSFRADLWGRRSVFAAVKKREVHLLSPDTFYSASEGGLRLIAREPVTGEALANARVEAFIESEDPNDAEKTVSQPLFAGQTDEFGVYAARFSAPIDAVRGTLVVKVTNDLGMEVISRAITVVKEDKILVTTDKPIYQPGQTIHLRALALSRPNLHPAANAPVLLEVRDGKGNKIFKITSSTNEFGVASADFKLATQLNMGEFKLNAVIGETTAEKTVTVEHYVLPKYKVALSTDKAWYRPGDTLTGVISANYLFGKPVAGGHITVIASQFDVGFNAFANFSATLDADGNFPLSIELPTYFAAGGLDQDKAFVQLDVKVVDDAEHEQELSRQVTIASGGLVLTTVPRENFVPGQPASFFVLATDPTGNPLETALTLSGNGIEEQATTSAAGIASFEFIVPEVRTLSFALAGTDAFGNQVSTTLDFDLNAATDQGAIALVTDRPLYAVGDVAHLEAFAHKNVKRVFVDVIRDAQTLLTTTINLEEGYGTYDYSIDVENSGTLHFEVYYASAAGNIVRASKLAFVEAANDLAITATLDAAEYRPGASAKIDFHVADNAGQGVQAAIGISIVDEAIYALQEMQPGLAKIFFRIEEELLKPKYEIHGFSAGDLVAGGEDNAARDEAASVLMASVADVSPYAIQVNTLAEAMTRSVTITKAVIDVDVMRLLERLGQLLDVGIYDDASAPLLAAVVDGEYADPWGQTYRVTASDAYQIEITSAGPDENFGNEDDVTISTNTWSVRQANNKNRGGWDDGGVLDGAGDFGNAADPQAAPPGAENDADGLSDEASSGDSGPRVRRYFPETLYFNPSLITDAAGNASFDLTMADSITTWRMTSQASSKAGQLGSGADPILVFQPFFIDIDFPVTLTQNDEISVPIALYNYLDTPQSVTLEVDGSVGPWFTLLDAAQKTVDLDANEVSVEYFRVRVDQVGYHPFRVTAIGSTMSDAIERRIEVLPDGKAFPVAVSGRLNADVAETIQIPANAVAGGSRLNVKIYPGMFSQVVEGLDSLLQMPSGCFEQTSSATYPNVLALRYMQDTGQSTPEIELKATEFISLGYQRLVSYEVPGGGFEWFGNTPAHRILTAYGLLEFTDMAQVYPVDEAVISRTQNWLASQQESDGRFKAAPEGIHEGATNNFQDSDLRATAYLTYSLLYSGYKGAGMSKAINWMKQNSSGADDAYTLALVASSLLLNNPSDPAAFDALDRLATLAKTKPGQSGDLIYWESGSESLYYSSGETMNMETTAMALLAFIDAGTRPDMVEGAVNFLIENKDSFGNWSSTQATILSLRAFIAMLDKQTESVDATVRVLAHGQLVDTLTVNASNSDVLQQVDLALYTIEGANDIQIEFDGTGSLLYQIAGEYYLPWGPDVQQPSDVLSIDVSYDRTQLEVNDRVTATASVSNNTDARLDMVMVDLGVAPGFDVITDGLTAAVNAGKVSRFELTGRQIIVYLYGLDPQETLSFSYELEARMPLTAQTPPSVAYLYYDPAVSSDAEPVEMNVL